MLSHLKEEDFLVLRGSLESGRQSPNSFGGMFIISIFLQALMFFLTHIVIADSSGYPFQHGLLVVHLVITIIIVILSIIYAVPAVYKRSQKFQYLLSIIISQNLFGIFAYFFTLFVMGDSNASKASLIMATIVTLLFGMLIFIVTVIRFYVLLNKGHYQKGTQKDELRSRFESKSLLPLAIFGGIGIVYIIQYLARNYYIVPFHSIFIAVLGLAIFYTMIFVLPEQLVILYCKYRFASFNYDENGNLKPLGNVERVRRMQIKIRLPLV